MALAPGCGPAEPGGLDSLDPGERATAIAKAAETDDRAAIPRLITLLGSDDPGTRLLAIGALEKLTGETFGYDYAAPEPARLRSIERWVEWQSAAQRAAGSS